MTLKELSSVLPGYTTLLVHTEDKCWTGQPAAAYVEAELLSVATVITATPIASYTMEVSIELKEENQ